MAELSVQLEQGLAGLIAAALWIARIVGAFSARLMRALLISCPILPRSARL